MADTVTLSAGSADGAVIATDAIGAAPEIHYQIVKLAIGALDTAVLAVAGNGATTTGTLRVTLANDSTGNIATIGTSVTPGTAAANLGKAEDAAHASGDTGVMALAVRSNTAASTSGADGDYQPLITNTTGHLWVDASGQTLTVGSHAVTNAGTFAVQVDGSALTSLQLIDNIVYAEDVASAPADPGALVMAMRQDTPGNTSGADGDYEPLRMSGGRVWVDASGVTLTVASHAVTNAGTFAVQESGAALTALQLIDNIVLTEDAAASGGEAGVQALVIRKDTGGTLASADGDFTPLQVDASGALRVTGGGGGTEYTEDAAAAADPVGTALILVRKDTPAALTTADGDNVAMRGTDYGAAYVTLLDTGGTPVSVGGGTQYTEDAAAAANPIGNAVNLIRDDSLARTVTADGDNVAQGGSAAGAAYVEIVGGTTKLGSSTDGLLVNLGANNDVTITSGTVTTVSTVTNVATIGTSVTPGTAAANLGKAEDAAHSSGDTGVMMLAVRESTATDLSAGATNGDYEPLQVDANGRLWAIANIDQMNGVAVSMGNGASGTGVQRVTIANDSTGLISVNPGTAANWGVYVEDAAETAGGNLSMAGAVRRDTLASSSGTSGDNSTINTTGEGALWVTAAPTATGGLTTFMASGSDGSSILVATAQAVKASAGVLYGYYAYNPEAAVTFVHFYNTAAASVTVGTTNPLFTLAIPAGSAANLTIPQGITFSNAGWSVAATTTAGGTGAPATGVSLVAWYK